MVRCAALQHCSKLRRSSQEPVPGYIWISNEILRTQWSKFSTSITIHPSQRSQRHTTATQTRSVESNTLQHHVTQSLRINRSSTGSYLQKRNGSAVPGPLEARKRRSLRKHITGASHSDIFGAGLDFDGSSLRSSIEKAGEGMKTRLESVYDHGNALATRIDEVWKWWSSYSEAPVLRKDDTMLPLTETSCANPSFQGLLTELDLTWIQAPENIHQLMQHVLRHEMNNQQKVMQQICSWVRAEVTLGSMHEIDVKALLWEADQSAQFNYSSTKLGYLAHVCEAIGEGIASSTIRPAKDFGNDTIWLLFRSLACLSTQEHILTSTLSYLLQSVAVGGRNECIQLLQGLLGTTQFMTGVRKAYTFRLLKILPKDISSAAVLGLCERLARSCYSHKLQTQLERSLQLKLLLIELSKHDLLTGLHNQQDLEVPWLHLERSLFHLGMPHIVAYLQTANEAEVCGFILRHVVKASPQAYTRSGEAVNATTQMNSDSGVSPLDHTYADLLGFLMMRWPHKVRRVTRFLYSFLRESGRAEECYNLSRHVFSKYGLGTRPSVEFFHNEISQWAKTNPLFAILLLATDPRSGSNCHPVLARTVASLPREKEALPAGVVPAMAQMMIKRYSPDLNVSDPMSKAPMAASSLLQLLLQPLAWGDLPERKAFHLFQKILTILAPVSYTLKKETSIAAIHLIAVKSLKNRQKISRRKMDWLGQVVTCLEGPQAWRETADRIEHWWSMIDAEDARRR